MLTKIETACANTILDCFFKNEEMITHMKLQKIFYFSSGVHLVNRNAYMAEHCFQAWPNGPVLPSLYYKLKSYGDAYITNLIEFENALYVYNEGAVFEAIKTTVEKIGHHTAWELSEMTHAKNGPWFKTVEAKGYKEDIDTGLILNYFKENRIF